jgi:hypothetical protein
MLITSWVAQHKVPIETNIKKQYRNRLIKKYLNLKKKINWVSKSLIEDLVV